MTEPEVNPPAKSPGTDAEPAVPAWFEADSLDASERARLIDIYGFSSDILERRYQLYDWCETKLQTLATVNSLLLGALFLLVGTRFDAHGVIRVGLVCITAGLLALSLALMLWHIIPTMDSKIGNYDNPRSTIVIDRLSKEDYVDLVMTMDIASMIRYNSNQSKGMSRNIMRNQVAIRWAALLTFGAMVSFAAILALSNLTK